MKAAVVSELGPFCIIPEWLFRMKLSPRALQFYIALALKADRDTGSCWPSHRTLAREMRCSEKAVRRAQEELIAVDALYVEARFIEGRQTSNVYVIRQIPPTNDQGEGATSDQGGVPSATREEPEPSNHNHKNSVVVLSAPSAPTQRGEAEGRAGEDGDSCAGLLLYGFSDDQAAALVREFGSDKILRQLGLMPARLKAHVVENVPAYLAESIRHDWDASGKAQGEVGAFLEWFRQRGASCKARCPAFTGEDYRIAAHLLRQHSQETLQFLAREFWLRHSEALREGYEHPLRLFAAKLPEIEQEMEGWDDRSRD